MGGGERKGGSWTVESRAGIDRQQPGGQNASEETKRKERAAPLLPEEEGGEGRALWLNEAHTDERHSGSGGAASASVRRHSQRGVKWRFMSVMGI